MVSSPTKLKCIRRRTLSQTNGACTFAAGNLRNSLEFHIFDVRNHFGEFPKEILMERVYLHKISIDFIPRRGRAAVSSPTKPKCIRRRTLSQTNRSCTFAARQSSNIFRAWYLRCSKPLRRISKGNSHGAGVFA